MNPFEADFESSLSEASMPSVPLTVDEFWRAVSCSEPQIDNAAPEANKVTRIQLSPAAEPYKPPSLRKQHIRPDGQTHVPSQIQAQVQRPMPQSNASRTAVVYSREFPVPRSKAKWPPKNAANEGQLSANVTAMIAKTAAKVSPTTESSIPRTVSLPKYLHTSIGYRNVAIAQNRVISANTIIPNLPLVYDHEFIDGKEVITCNRGHSIERHSNSDNCFICEHIGYIDEYSPTQRCILARERQLKSWPLMCEFGHTYYCASNASGASGASISSGKCCRMCNLIDKVDPHVALDESTIIYSQDTRVRAICAYGRCVIRNATAIQDSIKNGTAPQLKSCAECVKFNEANVRTPSSEYSRSKSVPDYPCCNKEFYVSEFSPNCSHQNNHFGIKHSRDITATKNGVVSQMILDLSELEFVFGHRFDDSIMGEKIIDESNVSPIGHNDVTEYEPFGFCRELGVILIAQIELTQAYGNFVRWASTKYRIIEIIPKSTPRSRMELWAKKFSEVPEFESMIPEPNKVICTYMYYDLGYNSPKTILQVLMNSYRRISIQQKYISHLWITDRPDGTYAATARGDVLKQITSIAINVRNIIKTAYEKDNNTSGVNVRLLFTTYAHSSHLGAFN